MDGKQHPFAIRGLRVAVYFAVTVCLTWPLAREGATKVGFTSELWHGDTLLVIWILRWGLHALSTDVAGFLHANAFHPAPDVLARSELLLGLLPPYGAVYWLTGNPVLALNALTFASIVASGLTMHWLVERWVGSEAAGYVAGFAFAFAPWRHMIVGGMAVGSPPGSVHLSHTELLPLILLSIDRCAVERSRLWASVTALLLAAQTTCSFYLGYMGFFAAAVYVGAALVSPRRSTPAADLALPAGAIALGAALISPIAIPYLRIAAAGSLTADWSSAAQQAAAVLGSPRAILAAYAGPGAVFLSLLAVAVARWRALQPRFLALLFLTLGSLLVAKGPIGFLGGWIAPFDWLSRVVPGLSNFRVPWRFGTLVSLGSSALAGHAIGELRTRLGQPPMRTAVTLGAIVAVLVPAMRGTPVVMREVPTGASVPAVYRWLAAHGDHGPLLELPVGRVGAEVVNGATAMYFSTYHWLPILNGHSGYPPASYQELKPYFEQLPRPDALRIVVDCTGLRWIVKHERRGAGPRRWSIDGALRLHEVFPTGDGATTTLYEVLLHPAGTCPLASLSARAD